MDTTRLDKSIRESFYFYKTLIANFIKKKDVDLPYHHTSSTHCNIRNNIHKGGGVFLTKSLLIIATCKSLSNCCYKYHARITDCAVQRYRLICPSVHTCRVTRILHLGGLERKKKSWEVKAARYRSQYSCAM